MDGDVTNNNKCGFMGLNSINWDLTALKNEKTVLNYLELIYSKINVWGVHFANAEGEPRTANNGVNEYDFSQKGNLGAFQHQSMGTKTAIIQLIDYDNPGQSTICEG